jgi:hypothetical protein
MQQDHACFWCGRGFVPRRDGGKPQVFCRPVCRRDFDTARRRCVAQAIASGVLTVGALRDASAATRALRRWGEGLSPLPRYRVARQCFLGADDAVSRRSAAQHD